MAGAACVPSMADAKGSNVKRPPNIVFLFSDDQRFDTLGCAGNPQIQTPNLDSLARQGVLFRHAYIMGGTSGAVCIPSRAMTLTGRSLFHITHGIDPGHTTLPQALRDRGYRTHAIGKWHNSKESLNRSFSSGSQIFLGGMTDQWRVPVQDFDPTGRYPKEAVRVPQGFSTEIFTDAAVKFLKDCDRDKPFLLYVAYTAPHDPRTAPEQYRAMVDQEALDLPPNFMQEHPFDNGELRIRDELLAPFPRTPGDIRRHLADYFAMIMHLDSQVGRLLRALDGEGLRDNTIVVFAGDNGLAVGQHGLMGKQNLYEHSVHVPLILSGPGIPRGETREALCYLLDIFPTLCDLTETPVPESVEGRSLMPVLLQGSPGREDLFFAYLGLQRAIRESRYKLIEYLVNGQRTTQLFDLKEDPWEIENLAGQAEHADRLESLRQLLARRQDELDDPGWRLIQATDG